MTRLRPIDEMIEQKFRIGQLVYATAGSVEGKGITDLIPLWVIGVRLHLVTYRLRYAVTDQDGNITEDWWQEDLRP